MGTTVRKRAEELLAELSSVETTVACLVMAFRDRTVMVWLDDDYPLGTIVRYLRAGGRPVGIIWWDGETTRGRVRSDFSDNEDVGHHLDELRALFNSRLSMAGLGAMAHRRATPVDNQHGELALPPK